MGYVACVPHKWTKQALLELTNAAARTFETEQENNTLRGLHVRLQRMGDHARGRVHVKLLGAHRDELTVPQPIDVQEALLTIWELPAKEGFVDDAVHLDACAVVLAQRDL